MSEFDRVTTDSAVAVYESASGIFGALLDEIRELSKKKPDSALSKNKIKIINAVLEDLLSFLSIEPEGKYLNLLDSDDVPQVSDALIMMVQFESAMGSFRGRYYKMFHDSGYEKSYHWITAEFVREIESLPEDESE